LALSDAQEDTLTLDPMAMNVVNRVAAGSCVEGVLQWNGGLLVQGTLAGNSHIDGHLIVWAGGAVRGRVRVNGDVYVFGTLGGPMGGGAGATSTVLECTGTVCIASTGICSAALHANALRLYQGAEVSGPFKTRVATAGVPVLRDALARNT